MAKEFILKEFLKDHYKEKTVTVSLVQSEYGVGFLQATSLFKEMNDLGLGKFKFNLNKFYFDIDEVEDYISKPDKEELTEDDIKELISVVKYMKKHAKLFEKILRL